MSKNSSDFSRRKFLTTGVTLAAGALVGCGVTKVAEPATAKADDIPALPWAYQPLDPEVVRKRAYENYYKGGCCYAAASALILTLKEKVGSPWDKMPIDMFKYGKGGALAWGTLCGALNGSLAVMNLAAGTDVDKIGDELMGWYTKFPFPSTKMDSFAKFQNTKTTIADSPLCHVSVSIWSNEANFKINSDQKADRCAKVSGDTAARAVEILNAWKEGKFAPVYAPGSEFASCLTCHNGAKSTLDNEQGKMSCISCHDEKTKSHP